MKRPFISVFLVSIIVAIILCPATMLRGAESSAAPALDFRSHANRQLVLPEKLAGLTNSPPVGVTHGVLESLTDSEFEALVTACLVTTNYVSRKALIIAAVTTKRPEVYDLLSHILFEQMHEMPPWPNKPDEAEGRAYMVASSFLLDFPAHFANLARTDDRAYQLIQQGCHRSFWVGRFRWKDKGLTDWVHGMTSHSIVALGGTGRPDALEKLVALRKAAAMDPMSSKGLFGVFDEAAYLYYRVQKNLSNRSKILTDATVHTGAEGGHCAVDAMRSYDEWTQGPEGREWNRLIGASESTPNTDSPTKVQQ